VAVAGISAPYLVNITSEGLGYAREDVSGVTALWPTGS
jgi:hypothetical protein